MTQIRFKENEEKIKRVGTVANLFRPQETKLEQSAPSSSNNLFDRTRTAVLNTSILNKDSGGNDYLYNTAHFSGRNQEEGSGRRDNSTSSVSQGRAKFSAKNRALLSAQQRKRFPTNSSFNQTRGSLQI